MQTYQCVQHWKGGTTQIQRRKDEQAQTNQSFRVHKRTVPADNEHTRFYRQNNLFQRKLNIPTNSRHAKDLRLGLWSCCQGEMVAPPSFRLALPFSRQMATNGSERNFGRPVGRFACTLPCVAKSYARSRARGDEIAVFAVESSSREVIRTCQSSATGDSFARQSLLLYEFLVYKAFKYWRLLLSFHLFKSVFQFEFATVQSDTYKWHD